MYPNFRFINGDNKRPFGSMPLKKLGFLKFTEKRVARLGAYINIVRFGGAHN